MNYEENSERQSEALLYLKFLSGMRDNECNDISKKTSNVLSAEALKAFAEALASV